MQKSHNTDTGSISYSIYGKGESVVFLHGFLGNKGIWKPFVNYFKSKSQVIAIDLPGHGNTSIVKEEMTMDFSALLLKEVLEKEGVSTFHIVGHSMGGYVGLAYAKLFPKQIKSITLFNSTAAGDNNQKQADRLKAVRIFDMNPSIFIDEAIKNLFFEPNLYSYSEEVKQLTQIAKDTSILGAQGSLRGMRLREDNVEWLSQQKFPKLYIAGYYDNTIPFSSIEKQVTITKAQLLKLENSGHMGFVEDKQKCIKEIESFILK